jgi:integrase/recombinase XerD
MKDDVYNYLFDGPFQAYCKKFIDYKRSLGFKICEPYCHRLRDMDNLFARFLLDQVELTINKEMAETYVALRENESVKTQLLRMSTIRQFALFMNRIGFNFYVYPETAFPKANDVFVPYIFTHEEITRLASVLDKIPFLSGNPKQHLVYPMLFRILYGCGLRLNEALNLRFSDLDMVHGHIILNNTKNNSQRMLPMSSSLLDYCRRYVEKMSFDPQYGGYYFPSCRGQNLHTGSVYYRLREFMRKANISKENGKPPRIHDLRHTFAVHSLEKMVAEGRDIYCSLPILSTYLGHQGIESTEKYLRLTKESFSTLIERMENYYTDVFPEVNHGQA